MYKFVFFVPELYLESVKSAVFAAGAGKIGAYEACAWQVLGQGQFLPMEGANPFLGRVNQIEVVPEYRVEMVCEEALMADVVRALRQAHPYETPAYEVIRLEPF